MAFKSDNQRKAVMAKLSGRPKSNITPQIINKKPKTFMLGTKKARFLNQKQLNSFLKNKEVRFTNSISGISSSITKVKRPENLIGNMLVTKKNAFKGAEPNNFGNFSGFDIRGKKTYNLSYNPKIKKYLVLN